MVRIREDELIEYIRRRIPSQASGALRIGIGHDAAIIHPRGRDWVITCDQFLEGVHFLADKHPPDSVGYKALARATSDIVAMAAQPRFFMLSLALPAKRTGAWLGAVLSGMARASRRFGLRLIGGDTARTPNENGRVALNVTVLGELVRRRAIGRAGAKPGDGIYVTGVLGQAQLGLELLLRINAGPRRTRKLLAHHFYPALPLDFALWLGRNQVPTAMMDISDGLSTDLTRLCKASGVGARIYSDQIPAVGVPESLRKRPSLDELTLALHGGEDYGLLFTAQKKIASRIPLIFGHARITRIGETVRGSGVKLVDANGKESILLPGGWDHFAKD
jgi:thiamine-monophosphate kinase